MEGYRGHRFAVLVSLYEDEIRSVEAVDRWLRPPRSFPAWTDGLTTLTRESATWPTCYFWRRRSAPSGSSVGLASVGSSMRCGSGGQPAEG